MAFTTTSVALVIMLVVPDVAVFFVEPRDEPISIWPALATLGIAIILVFATLYAAGLLWLLLACRLFARDEVEQLLKAGPNTRLEIWIFERFSRETKKGDGGIKI